MPASAAHPPRGWPWPHRTLCDSSARRGESRRCPWREGRRARASTCESARGRTQSAGHAPSARPPPRRQRSRAPGAGACRPRKRCSAWPCVASPEARSREAGGARAPHRPRPLAPSCTRRDRSSLVVVLVGDDLERLRAECSALVPGQQLDALLGLVEILRTAAREAHALLEDLERLLQPEIAGLELIYHLLEALECALKRDVGHPAPSPAPHARPASLRAAGSRWRHRGAPRQRASPRHPTPVW